jgi:hypothetical protein
MERQFIYRLTLIIGQEVNHLLDNDLAELQSIINDYLMNILFILLIDLYFKLIVVNNWIISSFWDYTVLSSIGENELLTDH